MDEGLHILQHSLGLDQYGQGKRYRNHFCTGPGSFDYTTCRDLVAAGFMEERSGNDLTGGDSLFIVTVAGVEFVERHSPPSPKLTRSQKRYRAWLRADSGLSFSEWLLST